MNVRALKGLVRFWKVFKLYVQVVRFEFTHEGSREERGEWDQTAVLQMTDKEQLGLRLSTARPSRYAWYFFVLLNSYVLFEDVHV